MLFWQRSPVQTRLFNIRSRLNADLINVAITIVAMFDAGAAMLVV
jgi:hypothetical protein